MGYIIVDPDTGAGAYLIEGKGNGAVLYLLGILLGLIITEMVILSVLSAAGSGGLGLGAILIIDVMMLSLLIPFFVLVASVLKNATDEQKSCFVGGLLLGITVATMSMGAVTATFKRPVQAIANTVLKYISMAGVGASVVFPATGDIGTCWRLGDDK